MLETLEFFGLPTTRLKIPEKCPVSEAIPPPKGVLGKIGFGGSYDKDSNNYNFGLQGRLNFAKGGVYNAKKIDMMSDQILESYDV